jgi:hypothetical protein
MIIEQSAFKAEAWAFAWLLTRKHRPRKGLFLIPRTLNYAIGGNSSAKIKYERWLPAIGEGWIHRFVQTAMFEN